MGPTVPDISVSELWQDRTVDFELSGEQEQLRASIRRFLADRAPVRPYVRSLLGDQRGTTDEVWQGLAQLGVTGLLVPTEHGGAGEDLVTMGVALEELGRAVHPGPVLASAVGAVRAVTAAGSPADRDRWLPGLASGEVVGALAADEPGPRFRWRHPVTTATRDGTQWRVTGTKTWVLGGTTADVVFVVAATTGGLGLFAVERSDLRAEPTPSVDLTRSFATITLDATPASRVGGDDDRDDTAAIGAVVDAVGLALAADGLGAAERALELAVEYATHRHQFGVPIGSFQAVQHLCADMLRQVEVGRAGVYYALWACDHAEPAERHRAATMAGAFSSDAFAWVAAGAIQVFGGIGFTWEHDAHLYYKRLLTLQTLWGTAEEHLDELASIVIG
ncbi:acyl-CoA dehydrogenase family protein [Rhabdothermincola sediminis]|uniref:acyl-CoA dehydrogenase family protein n=1 Tax=Rhabdothermincola sediminis TaxID=2751370 RepID=UPI001AA0388B|nr:acyl-CoA dehydrogenase family protein [Rhabdothermincola sediminis]